MLGFCSAFQVCLWLWTMFFAVCFTSSWLTGCGYFNSHQVSAKGPVSVYPRNGVRHVSSGKRQLSPSSNVEKEPLAKRSLNLDAKDAIDTCISPSICPEKITVSDRELQQIFQPVKAPNSTNQSTVTPEDVSNRAASESTDSSEIYVFLLVGQDNFPTALPSLLNFKLPSDIAALPPAIESGDVAVSCLNDCDLSSDMEPGDTTAPISKPTTDINAIMEEALKKAAMAMINGLFKVLDTTSLQDPSYRAALQITSSQIPTQYASVAKIKDKLDNLIQVFDQLQEAHLEFNVVSEKRNEAISEEKLMLVQCEEECSATAQELVAAEKHEADLLDQMVNIQKSLGYQE